jgi:hypothetical protein
MGSSFGLPLCVSWWQKENLSLTWVRSLLVQEVWTKKSTILHISFPCIASGMPPPSSPWGSRGRWAPLPTMTLPGPHCMHSSTWVPGTWMRSQPSSGHWRELEPHGQCPKRPVIGVLSCHHVCRSSLVQAFLSPTAVICQPVLPALRTSAADPLTNTSQPSITASQTGAAPIWRPTPGMRDQININIISWKHTIRASKHLTGCTESHTMTWGQDTTQTHSWKTALVKKCPTLYAVLPENLVYFTICSHPSLTYPSLF